MQLASSSLSLSLSLFPVPPSPQAPNWIASTGLPGRVRRDSVSEEFFKNTRFESVVREVLI